MPGVDRRARRRAAAERGRSNLKYFKDFRVNHGSSQGQNLAETGLLCFKSLDSLFYVADARTAQSFHSKR